MKLYNRINSETAIKCEKITLQIKEILHFFQHAGLLGLPTLSIVRHFKVVTATEAIGSIFLNNFLF